MREDRYLDLFKEKGYCIIKEIDIRFDNDISYIQLQEALISKLENTFSGLSQESFFDDDSKDKLCPYKIYFDKSRVEINIIRDLKTYVEEVLTINREIEKQNTVNRQNSYTYYRGHSSWRYLLKPSIYREDNIKLLENEDRLFRDITASNPHFFHDCNTTLEMLVTLQHHGISTRLMDITDNPLISLFFACNGKPIDGIHGEVTVFNVPEHNVKYYDSDKVSVLANLTKCNIEFDISSFSSSDIEWRKINAYMGLGRQEKINECMEKEILEFNKIKIISELVHFIREDKAYFLPRVDPVHLDNFVVVVKPKMVIDRIVNQSGAFVLFGIKKSKRVCSDLNINAEGFKQKIIIIPSIYKQTIMKDLKLFNINDSTVFCDMDNTARYFKDKYMSTK